MPGVFLKWVISPASAFIIAMPQVGAKRRAADRQGMPAFLAAWFMADCYLAALFIDWRLICVLLNNDDVGDFNHHNLGKANTDADDAVWC